MWDGVNLAPGARRTELKLAVLALLLCAALWLVFSAIGNHGPVGLSAERGTVAIPGEALEQGVIFSLDGPWQVYWGRLLDPDDLAGADAPEPSGSLRLPGSWRGERYAGDVSGGTGAATFRLSIMPPEDNRSLTLRLFDLRLAYRLWANGTLVAQSGVPGMDAASEQPERSLVLASFDTSGEPVDLVLQLSNHGFREGGIGDPILLAKAGILQTARDQVWIFSAFFCGMWLTFSHPVTNFSFIFAISSGFFFPMARLSKSASPRE